MKRTPTKKVADADGPTVQVDEIIIENAGSLEAAVVKALNEFKRRDIRRKSTAAVTTLRFLYFEVLLREHYGRENIEQHVFAVMQSRV